MIGKIDAQKIIEAQKVTSLAKVPSGEKLFSDIFLEKSGPVPSFNWTIFSTHETKFEYFFIIGINSSVGPEHIHSIWPKKAKSK